MCCRTSFSMESGFLETHIIYDMGLFFSSFSGFCVKIAARCPQVAICNYWRLGILIPVIFYASQVITFCIFIYEKEQTTESQGYRDDYMAYTYYDIAI